jgi:hypothetical protein
LERLDNRTLFEAIAFADDLAITCAVKKNDGVSGRIREILRTVNDWCASVGLTLAKDKTEVILITGMRVRRVVSLNLDGMTMNTVEAMKYLGVMIDSNRRFDKHIAMVCDKADTRTGALRGILPNINGPLGLARRLYYGVWESTATYGAPVWADAMRSEKNRKSIKRAQRSPLCITSTAYRTVSHATLCVLTGNLPIYNRVRMLKAMYERKKIYKTLAVQGEVVDEYIKLKEDLKEIKMKALREQQAEWSNYKMDNFTRKLVGDASIFAKRRRDIDHFTMQILTGHGIFNSYRKRIGKEVDTKCWDCGDENDDAEHVLFSRPKWINKRIELENSLGATLNADNLMGIVMTKDESWE